MMRLISLAFVMRLLWSVPSLAESVYTYTGNTFSEGCTSCSIDGYFAVPTALAPNIGDSISGYTYIIPDSFSFTNNDGVTIRNVNQFQSAFSFKTDSSGNIVDWVIELTYDHSFGNNIGSANCDICTIGDGVADSSYFDSTEIGRNVNDAGIWNVTETPEPSPLLPSCSALLSMGLLTRRMRMNRSSGRQR